MTQDEIIETNRRQMFAAARGARIQIFVSETRIHPDDEHLQYGPVSTALREMAINDLWYPPSWQISLASTVSLDVEREFSELLFSRRENEDYPLFYLFLAEFLADEGM